MLLESVLYTGEPDEVWVAVDRIEAVFRSFFRLPLRWVSGERPKAVRV